MVRAQTALITDEDSCERHNTVFLLATYCRRNSSVRWQNDKSFLITSSDILAKISPKSFTYAKHAVRQSSAIFHTVYIPEMYSTFTQMFKARDDDEHRETRADVHTRSKLVTTRDSKKRKLTITVVQGSRNDAQEKTQADVHRRSKLATTMDRRSKVATTRNSEKRELTFTDVQSSQRRRTDVQKSRRQGTAKNASRRSQTFKARDDEEQRETRADVHRRSKLATTTDRRSQLATTRNSEKHELTSTDVQSSRRRRTDVHRSRRRGTARNASRRSQKQTYRHLSHTTIYSEL